MNSIKMQICKELVDVSKDAYDKYKSGSGDQAKIYSYEYRPCQGQCRQGGLMSNNPMQLLSSIKKSKQLKSLPQTLKDFSTMKNRPIGYHGGVKKILPQVLKGIKSKI